MSELSVQPLVELGFTNLEAEVYAFLAAESPATGYRVAQALQRPVGNIYKAIEALQAKGAVLVEQEAETRHVRAVPAEELLDRLERQFRRRKQDALAALADAACDPIDDRIYRLASPEQLLERCRVMMARATSFIVGTFCPSPFAELRDDLVAATRRSVTVGVKLFEPCELDGVEVVGDPRGVAALEHAPGQWLSLTIDGREWLQGLFSTDGRTLLHGVWSGSAFLAWTFFTGLSSDLVLAAVKRALKHGANADEIAKLIDRLAPFESPRSAGKLELLKRHRPRRN